MDIYCDSAEQTLIEGMRIDAAKRNLCVEIHNARKGPINDRIRFYTVMMGAGRYKILKGCTSTIDALSEAMWDSKVKRLMSASMTAQQTLIISMRRNTARSRI